MLGHQIRAGVAKRCDFCHHTIPADKVSYKITEGDARGTYHGRMCYQAALKHYRELQKKV